MNKENKFTSPKIPFTNILRWAFSRHFLIKKTIPSIKKLKVEYQNDLPQKDFSLWLGHASLWTSINNFNLVIDPVFENIPMYRRLTPLPVAKDKLKADVILITHSHYDHFSTSSVKYLVEKNPNVNIIAPMGFSRYLKKVIKKEQLVELDWWQNININDINITFVPSKHWSNRTGFDKNKTLWGGFVIEYKNKTIYHAGDSAYDGHFCEISNRFDIDDAFLPIGAYRPEYIMKHNHMDPEEAMKACTDLRAKRFIPIHYGTFKISDEHPNEPLEWFLQLQANNHYPFKTKILNIGEILF